MKSSFKLLYLFVVPIVDVISLDYTDTAQYRLHKELFAKYQPHLRPVFTPGDTVVVKLEYELNAVSGLDDVNQVMYTVGFLVAEWQDAFLVWNPEDYANIKHMVVPPNQVWLPDLAIKNSLLFEQCEYNSGGLTICTLWSGDEKNVATKDANFFNGGRYRTLSLTKQSGYRNWTNNPVPPWQFVRSNVGNFYDASFTRDFRVDVNHTGRVIWAFGGNFATSCTLDMTFYPFDLQKCDIDIENWAYTREAVNLINKTSQIHLQDFSKNGEWDLDHTGVSVETFTEDTHVGKSFPRVKFSIYLSRKFRYYLINIVLPALFVIAISLNVFWLPPDSGEKVSLGITVLLAFSVFQLVIMEHTPRTSDFTPVMTLLFTIIMGMSTFSVLTSIMVLFFHHHGAESRPNKYIRLIAFGFLAKILRMQNQVPDYNQIITEVKDEIQVPAKRNSSIRIMENHSESPKQSPTGSPKVFFSPPAGNPGREDYLRQILFYVRELMEKVQVKERDGVIMDEWKCLAIVMDRTFFWIAFIATMIIIPTLLFRVDEKH